MGKLIELPDNLIGIEDQESLEAFGAHEISHGRATRFHWDYNNNDDPVFELYRGGADEVLTLKITRDRKKDEFQATTKGGDTIINGTLDEVMIKLDKKLKYERDEGDTSA